MTLFKKAKKYLEKHKWASILFEVSLIIGVLLLFSWFQNSGTIASENKPAPDFTLQSIDGETYQLSKLKGKKVLIYFFAPWCSICHMSEI
ncbi:MAG TPA: redoxin domain-containing protein, partial [Oceanospirillales bacterium]|nr:redoxin domain-containing protein [Oceanospirillales bacterium]